MLSCSASSGEFCWHSHWKNESRAHSLPNNCRNISIPLKTAAFRRSLMDGRQLFPYQIMEGLLVIHQLGVQSGSMIFVCNLNRRIAYFLVQWERKSRPEQYEITDEDAHTHNRTRPHRLHD